MENCTIDFMEIILLEFSLQLTMYNIFTTSGQKLLNTIGILLVSTLGNMSEELYKKGLAHAKIEDYEEAIKCFDKAVELDPNNALVWISKANALTECGNDVEARKCLEVAAKIEPKYDFSQTLKNGN
jgi:tetratricopeptide (TPR) repeat protein